MECQKLYPFHFAFGPVIDGGLIKGRTRDLLKGSRWKEKIFINYLFYPNVIPLVPGILRSSIVQKIFCSRLDTDGSMKFIIERLTVIVEFFPHGLIGIFGAANESVYYTDFAVRAFRIYLCMVVFACVNKAAFIFLQAMGKAVASTMLSMVREIVSGVGFALLLPGFYGLDGVLYSMPVSDILTFLVSGMIIVRTYRQLNGMRVTVQTQDAGKRLDFACHS